MSRRGVCLPEPVDVASDALDATAADAPPPPPDGTVGDGAPLMPGDSLVVSLRGRRIGVNFAACLTPMVLHADGSSSAAADIAGTLAVAIRDTAVAIAGERGDCEPTAAPVAVLGVAPGTTTATVTLASGDRSLSGAVQIEVVPFALTLTVTDAAREQGLRAPIGVDTPTPLLGVVDLNLDVDPATGTHRPPYDSELVWRLLQCQVADPSVAMMARAAAATRRSPDEWTLRGVRAGRTAATCAYGLPGHVTAAAPVSVTAFELGALQQLTRVELWQDSPALQTDLSVAPRVLDLGVCGALHLFGVYGTPPTAMVTEVREPIAWTTTGGAAEVTPATPARFCARTAGEGSLAGCVGAMCTRVRFAVYPAGAIASVAATLLDDAPVSAAYVPPVGFSNIRVCPHVRGVATLADGSPRDLTTSAVAQWFSAPGDGGRWQLMHAADGSVVADGGYPCVLGSLQPGAPGAIQSYAVSFAFGSRVSAPVTFRVVHP